MEPISQSPVTENQTQVVQQTSVSPSNPPQPPLPIPPSPPQPAPRKGMVIPLVILLLILALVGGLLFAGWYFQSQLQKINKVPTPASAGVVAPHKLVIGTDPTFQPMEYVVDDKYIGYDIDLANYLGKELGAQVEIKNIVFDDLFTALEQKKVDMVISGVTITDERKQKYDFSEPYLNAGQVIITRKDDITIKNTADIKNKKIAVQKGTTNETEALNHTSADLVIRYPDFVQATKALVEGQVDALFSDLPAAKGIITANPTLKIASDPFTNEYYGIVFRKSDPNIKQINEALEAIRIKGILTDLKQKWLD